MDACKEFFIKACDHFVKSLHEEDKLTEKDIKIFDDHKKMLYEIFRLGWYGREEYQIEYEKERIREMACIIKPPKKKGKVKLEHFMYVKLNIDDLKKFDLPEPKKGHTTLLITFTYDGEFITDYLDVNIDDFTKIDQKEFQKSLEKTQIEKIANE